MSEATESILLAPLRDRIDRIDASLVDLLGERMNIVRQVIDLKARHRIPARLDDRVEAVVAHVRSLAAAKNCSPDFIEAVWRGIIEWTIAFEETFIADATTSTHRQESH